ncbi:ROK family protein [Candidatus Igneacidithiobacillus taiwanensis]|uniref:ROK family protein n=1 Tax=Candidatus Igneacidithiobacillus taiwanensis TaxID=1945924 RepID=UPI0028A270F5|nr:ROK family protein [Candidatus Igneacidithiobacillus taiwanensis]MCE5360982.1 ROK family protein [Acidithiobacillus sp.]
MNSGYLGIDVGGTNLRFGVYVGDQCVAGYRTEVNLAERCAQAANPEAAQQLVLDALAGGFHRLREQCPQLAGVGVAFPGFITADGILHQSPNLPQLHDFALEAALAEHLQVPVVLENDANAAAFGEFRSCQQSHPELQSLLYVGLGTGVGGGWVHAGRPWRGQHGTAMEIGHLIVVPGGRRCGCGNQGCLEQYASVQGLVSSYLEYSGMHADSLIIAQLARDGNPEARRAFQVLAEFLAAALAHAAKLLDCGQIRVGGGLSGAWDCFGDELVQQFRANLIPVLREAVEIGPGNHDDDAGMRGAALLAQELLSS